MNTIKNFFVVHQGPLLAYTVLAYMLIGLYIAHKANGQ